MTSRFAQLRGAVFFLEPAISRVPPECRFASPVRAKVRKRRYVRYMDDIVLLGRTRWAFLRALAALHEEIAALRVSESRHVKTRSRFASP